MHDSHWIFQAVEAGHLSHDRTRAVDPELLANLLHLRIRQLLVLLRERIDAGVKKILRNRKLLRKRLRREDRSVILLDERPQKLPDFRVGVRKVDMATPDPVCRTLRPRADQSRW